MFHGFTMQTSEFLWDLSFNNERPWFLAHKDLFESVLNTPFKELAADTVTRMRVLYPGISFESHTSRIYRDARRLFGRGPYKDHLWFTIWNSAAGKNGPAFWFEIGAAQYSYGMGFWSPSPEYMEAYRKSISSNPSRFERLAADIETHPEFSIFGEEYKRPKGDFGPLINKWYNRKHVGLECCRDFGGDLLSQELPDILAKGYAALMPMYEFFLEFYLSVGK